MNWFIVFGAIICGLFLCYRSIRMIWSLKHLISYRPNHLNSNTIPDVSLIICSHGLANQLPKYLPKFAEQKGLNYEIILVVENSPHLKELKEIAHKNSNIVIIDISGLSLPYKEKKRALQVGISVAKHSWIATSDDDCYPKSDTWLLSLASKASEGKHKIILGFSPYVYFPKFLGKLIRFDSIITFLKSTEAVLAGRAYMGMGRNMLFHRSLWNADYLNKYKHLGYADDDTLVLSLANKKLVTIVPEAIVFSFPKTSWKDWFSQKTRHLNSGLLLPKSITLLLALDFLACVLFFIAMWYWVSFMAFSIWWVLGLITTLLLFTIPFGILYNYTNLKNKMFFWLIPLWIFHSLLMLILPFFSLKKIRWK